MRRDIDSTVALCLAYRDGTNYRELCNYEFLMRATHIRQVGLVICVNSMPGNTGEARVETHVLI